MEKLTQQELDKMLEQLMTEGTIRCGRCILVDFMTLEDFNI